MAPPRSRRAPVLRSLGLALAGLGIAAALIGGIEVAIFASDPLGPTWMLAQFTVVGWIYVAAGLVAWWRRPSNRMGAVLALGGLAWLLAALVNANVAVLAAVGSLFATFPLAVVVHLLLAFPSGQLPGRGSRSTVAAGYGVALVLQAPHYLFAPAPPPHHLLSVADRPELVTAGSWTQTLAGAVVVVTTAVILGDRLRRADAAHRRVLAPLFGYGIFAVLFIPVSANIAAPLLDLAPATLATVQLAVVGVLPLAFLLAVLRGGFARTVEIEELGTWLGAGGGAKPTLRAALAHALGDDSLDLIFWVPSQQAYVDSEGRVVDPWPTDPSRGAVEIDLRGHRIGAIVYDAGLLADPELVRAAGRVIAIAADHERLTADLLASQEALRQSRIRLVEAGDRERHRIAQNLHDGLQVRMVLLALQAQKLARELTGAQSRDAATDLRVGIDAAATELRRLVHEVMPAVLIERGLVAATEDLADRMPVATRVTAEGVDGALSETVERTAYFVVAEGLTNAVKHAHAGELGVSLVRVAGCLVVEVSDDGVGGASPGAGSGLRGLADRVDVLGGRLRIDSPRHGGTHLVVELPCVS